MIRWLLKFLIPKASNPSQIKRLLDATRVFRQCSIRAKESGGLSFSFYPHWFDLSSNSERLLIKAIEERGYDVVPYDPCKGYLVYFPGVYDGS